MMNTCRNLTLLLFVVTVFSACSSTHHAQTARKSTPARQNTDHAEDLTFIEDIALDREGHSAALKSNAYHSVKPAPEADLVGASDLQVRYADRLDVSPKDIDNPTLFQFIDQWWGTPYRYGGDSKNGIDCSAFSQALYAVVFGIGSIPRTAQEQYEDSRKIKRQGRLKEGDLVFFRIHSRQVTHVGVYLQNNKFVHASFSSGVTIGDLTDRYWQRYFVCGGEPKALGGVDSADGGALARRE